MVLHLLTLVRIVLNEHLLLPGLESAAVSAILEISGVRSHACASSNRL